jgi:hypothetical protein
MPGLAAGSTRSRMTHFGLTCAHNEKRHQSDRVLAKALRHSRLSNLIVYDLVGFMYFEEAVPAAKCDALANTYL